MGPSVNTASQTVTTGLANSGARKVDTWYASLGVSRPNNTATHGLAIYLTDFSDVCVRACTSVHHSITNVTRQILCFADRASRYNRVKKNQLEAQHILSIFRQNLHVSGVSRPIIRRYNSMYTTIGTYYCFRWQSVVLVGLEPNTTTNSHLKRISTTCTHTVVLYLLMMGLDTPETCRGLRNILRISLHQFGISLLE